MTEISEVAADIYRISTFVPQANLGFAQFLVKDDEPLLFHTGLRQMFPVVRDAVASIIDPSELRWVAFSHVEADECGSLNEWLEVAPQASAMCSATGALVSVNDLANRPARGLVHDEVFSTGSHRFRFQWTPHVPHCWEAGLLFDETTGTLLCSDLFHQNGHVEALTENDVVGPARQTLVDYEATGLFSNYMPYTNRTDGVLQSLAELQPRALATMHGSTFVGDGAQALRDLATMMRETLE